MQERVKELIIISSVLLKGNPHEHNWGGINWELNLYPEAPHHWIPLNTLENAIIFPSNMDDSNYILPLEH